MNYFSTAVSIVCLGLAASLPAQEGEKQKPPETVKAAATSKDANLALAKDKAIKAIDKFIDDQRVDKKDPDWRTKLNAPPQQAFDAASDYFWHLDTSVGALKIKLYADSAPNHVTCGIYLTRLGYYDTLKFHRIIKGFMAQGGCPIGTGSGGPGYRIAGEFPKDGPKHSKAGILSTANAGPNTDGSQFFLCFKPQPGLDGGYTVWGEVVEGMDTLKAMEAAGTVGEGRVTNPPTITKAWISVEPKGEKKSETPKDGEKK